jgi:hypothetical protein
MGWREVLGSNIISWKHFPGHQMTIINKTRIMVSGFL